MPNRETSTQLDAIFDRAVDTTQVLRSSSQNVDFSSNSHSWKLSDFGQMTVMLGLTSLIR